MEPSGILSMKTPEHTRSRIVKTLVEVSYLFLNILLNKNPAKIAYLKFWLLFNPWINTYRSWQSPCHKNSLFQNDIYIF